MPTNHRYLLASTPPVDLSGNIDDIRKWVAATFGAVRAAKPPVHITLIAPFELPAEKEEQLFLCIRQLADQLHSFHLQLKDFDYFENNRQPVAFIHVVDNPKFDQLTKSLASNLKRFFPEVKANIKASNRAHITIAYRDTSSIFPALKAELAKQSFNASFDVRSIMVFRWHGDWRLIHQFSFGNDGIGLPNDVSPTLF